MGLVGVISSVLGVIVENIVQFRAAFMAFGAVPVGGMQVPHLGVAAMAAVRPGAEQPFPEEFHTSTDFTADV